MKGGWCLPSGPFNQALGCQALLSHLSCSVPLSRYCLVWLGEGKSVPAPTLTAGSKETLAYFWYHVCSLMSPPVLSGFAFPNSRVLLGAELHLG